MTLDNQTENTKKPHKLTQQNKYKQIRKLLAQTTHNNDLTLQFADVIGLICKHGNKQHNQTAYLQWETRTKGGRITETL